MTAGMRYSTRPSSCTGWWHCDFCGVSTWRDMHELPLSPGKLKLYSYHKWIGITAVDAGGVARDVAADAYAPPLPSDMAAWQRRASQAVHGAAVVLMIAIPCRAG